jgi:hypothetical protein
MSKSKHTGADHRCSGPANAGYARADVDRGEQLLAIRRGARTSDCETGWWNWPERSRGMVTARAHKAPHRTSVIASFEII